MGEEKQNENEENIYEEVEEAQNFEIEVNTKDLDTLFDKIIRFDLLFFLNNFFPIMTCK